jgi:hypothetical protein
MVLSKQKAHLARIRQIIRAKRTSLPVTNEDPGPSTSLQANNDPTGTEEPLRGLDGLEEPRQNTTDGESSLKESSSDHSGSDESSSDDPMSSDESDLEPMVGDAGGDSFNIVPTLEWRESAGNSLKRLYGVGSESTKKRQRRHECELKRAASNTLDITDLFRRQQDLGISVKSVGDTKKFKPGHRSKQSTPGERDRALDDLIRLLESKPEQIKKYGHILYPESDFDRRHRMVRSFLCRQKEKDGTRREMATAVAKNYNRGGHTARKIVKWEKGWVQNRRIPESKAGKHQVSLSLPDDEATLCAIRDFMKTQGDGRHNQLFSSPSGTW